MNKTSTLTKRTAIFGSKMIVMSGLLIAMSIVLGKFLAFNIGTSIRISFENLPILMAGIFFGPVIGGIVGAGADLIGCVMAGYAINYFITIGAFAIGFMSGLLSKYIFKKKHNFLSIEFSIIPAHIIGSMLIKSIGMYIYYHTPLEVLAIRIPIYIVTGLAETYIIYLLLQNKAFSSQVERMCKK